MIKKVWYVIPMEEAETRPLMDMLETHLEATADTPDWYVKLLRATGIRITKK